MSSNNSPFSFKIFLPDGTVDGLRIIGKSHWTGKGIVFNRSNYKEASKREEFQKTGVYILVGDAEDGTLPTIYIGEGEPVIRRLNSHYADKDFWNWGVFFVSTDNSLNKAHVKNLESQLIELATKAKRAKLDNSVGSQAPTLSEWEQADVDSFLDDMLSIFPLLGLSAFRQTIKKSNKKYPTLATCGSGVSAKGQDTDEGFVVFKGSEAKKTHAPSMQNFLVKMREELVESGVILDEGDKFMFLQDYTFKSPSTAASVVLARNANGRIEWKNEQGVTLRDIQTEGMDLSQE
ncbi:GIY-YIG nuclease family protein [Maridesulfovibrio sp. FT414]|uniref:GIY-YIG nuclease family protein n=1 Tax=Maridesulfovibrio sp. FT414 TaxID=2979469 RepID=UPI003D804393